jgi:hypothetical protein
VRSWSTFSQRGVVSARYSFSLLPPKDPPPDGSKKYNPVDVELAWYATATGKLHKVSIPQVKPFRVGRSTPSAVTEIVDGGLLFLPTTGEAPLYFITHAGKVQTMPRPAESSGLPYTSAIKNGAMIALAQSTQEDVRLTLTNDSGKTWSSTMWTTGSYSELVALEGKPTLVLGGWAGEMGGTTGLIPFLSLTPDPPNAVRFPMPIEPYAGKGPVACSKPGVEIIPTSGDEARELHVRVEGEPAPINLVAQTGVMRGMADGTTCTAQLTPTYMDDKGELHAHVSTSDPTHGWLTRRKDEYNKFEARPLSCTLP